MKNLLLILTLLITIASCKKEDQPIKVQEITDYSPYLGTWYGYTCDGLDTLVLKEGNKYDSQHYSQALGTSFGNANDKHYIIFDNNTAIIDIDLTPPNDTSKLFVSADSLYMEPYCYTR